MELIGANEIEAETMALHRARSCLCGARSSVIESFDFELEARPQARPAKSTDNSPKAQGRSQATAASDGASMMPLSLASIPTKANWPKLVREFREIMTKKRSTRCNSEPQHLQDQRRIFREWMQRDFSAFFSLKALQEAEIALTKLYQAQQMTKVQYESFVSFFENLKALKDQHLKAERQANMVRCYKEKHTRTCTTLQQLVEEGSSMEDRIIVVVAEIQKLEEQLSALKAEQMSLSIKLYEKMEEVKKVNHEVEESEAQLANNNIALEEPGRIFTIMQTYHSRIAALAKDVNLLI